MKMKARIAIIVVAGVLAAVLSGCGSKEQVKTGFLSDYSKLHVQSKTELRFVNKQALSQYNRFIIEPIQTHLYGDVKIDDEDLQLLRQYMYKAAFTAIETNNKVVLQPGHGVGRLRIALTNLKESNVALNVLPQTKLTGLGLGAASVEAEMVDSITGDQIMVVVKSQSGNQFSLDGYSKWSDAKAIMDKWGKLLEKRLAEAD